MLSEDLRDTERQNIDSAKAYFRDIADEAKFAKTDGYEALIQAIT